MADMFQDLIENPYYNDYWRELNVNEQIEKIDVPIFHYASWYDRYPDAQSRLFNAIRERGGERARESGRLQLGPWLHGGGGGGAGIAGAYDEPGHRGSRLRPRGQHRLQRAAPAVVRLSRQGDRERHRGGAAHQDLRDGRQHLAVRERIPPRPHGLHRLLPPVRSFRIDQLPERRASLERAALVGRAAGLLRVRPDEASFRHRRRPARPADGGPGPSPGGPPQPHLHDPTPRRRPRGDGMAGPRVLRLVVGGGHGLGGDPSATCTPTAIHST